MEVESSLTDTAGDGVPLNKVADPSGTVNVSASAGAKMSLIEGGTEEEKAIALGLKEKYKLLRRQAREVESSNGILQYKLRRAKKIITRLRLERSYMFDKLDQFNSGVIPVLDSNGEVMNKSFKAIIDGTNNQVNQSYAEQLNNSTASLVSAQSTPIKSEKTKRRSRAERDPNAPRKPANAFFWFCQGKRSELHEEKDENGELLPHREVTKQLGSMWKAMDEETRQPFFELYVKDRDRYHSEMNEYTAKKALAEEQASVSTTATPTNLSAGNSTSNLSNISSGVLPDASPSPNISTTAVNDKSITGENKEQDKKEEAAATVSLNTEKPTESTHVEKDGGAIKQESMDVVSEENQVKQQ